MPTIEENYLAWNENYTWPQDGEEWGSTSLAFHQRIRADFFDPFVTGATVLEIGPGHGRWTKILAEHAQRIVLVDIAEKNLTFCQNRFQARVPLECIQSDGKSLPGVGTESVDFVWSFNAFVHMEKQVIASYLQEIYRVLKPGLHCAFDHPGRNPLFLKLAFLDRLGPSGKKLYEYLSLGRVNTEFGDGWRSHVSTQMVRRAAQSAGFEIVLHRPVYYYCANKNGRNTYKDYLILLKKPE